MTSSAEVIRALDAALDAVNRAERRGLRTRDDRPASAELGRLRLSLAAERELARHGSDVDPERVGELVREVASWTPDNELKLLAALGAVIQAARR